jgi:hypothetical protein
MGFGESASKMATHLAGGLSFSSYGPLLFFSGCMGVEPGALCLLGGCSIA